VPGLFIALGYTSGHVVDDLQGGRGEVRRCVTCRLVLLQTTQETAMKLQVNLRKEIYSFIFKLILILNIKILFFSLEIYIDVEAEKKNIYTSKAVKQ